MCKDCYYWERNKEKGFENSGSCEHMMGPSSHVMEDFNCELCYDVVLDAILSRGW